MIRVALAGASGKMGREVVRAVSAAEDMQLVAAVSRSGNGEDVGTLAGIGPIGVPLQKDLRRALEEAEAGVLVDFTAPDAVMHHIGIALELGVPAVVGTTGLTEDDIAAVDRAAREAGVGVLIAPNFALGAVLMMRFAREARRYLPQAEIVELHHDRKKDAPSGTALHTAHMMARVLPEESFGPAGDRADGHSGGPDVPARGTAVGNIRVHSVRLPGLVAHQEVIFGGPGQVLTIRHDATDRSCFMPGVLLGIRRVGSLCGVVYGLEPLLFPESAPASSQVPSSR